MLSLHVTFKAFEPSVLKLVQNTLENICTSMEKNHVNASLRVVKKPTLKKKMKLEIGEHLALSLALKNLKLVAGK